MTVQCSCWLKLGSSKHCQLHVLATHHSASCRLLAQQICHACCRQRLRALMLACIVRKYTGYGSAVL
jgi:hypothetical protein